MADRPATRLRLLLVAVIVTAVGWVGREIPTFGYVTLLDDDTNIFFNPHLGVPDSAFFRWAFTDFEYVHRYMPLGWLGFSAAYLMSGLEPWGYHLLGLMLHGLNAVLVFLIVERLLQRFAPSADSDRRAYGAAGAALLWALHPLRVESSAWCSGLLYTQGATFAFAAFYARVVQLEAVVEKRDQRVRIGFAVVLLSFAASLLTYPMMLFLPMAIALLDESWFRGLIHGKLERRRRWIEVGLLWILALGAVGVTLGLRATMKGNLYPPVPLAEFSLLSRALQAGYVLAVYLWRTLWPVGLNPVRDTLFEVNASDWIWWAALATIAACSWLAWRTRRTAPFLGVGWLAYVLTMVPFLGFTEHPHTAADRYSYVTSIAGSIVWALAWMKVKGTRVRFVGLGMTTFMVVSLGFLSIKQARIWRDAEALHRFILTQQNDETARGITRARLAKLDYLQGQVAAARVAVGREIQADPNNAGVARTWRELAPMRPLTSAQAGRPLQEWEEAPVAFLHLQIAQVQIKAGRVVEALAHLDAAIGFAPQFFDARFLRGMLRAQGGRPLEAFHDWLELQSDRSALAVGRRDYLAERIALAFAVQPEPMLAQRVRQRALLARSSNALQSAIEPPVPAAISPAVSR